MSKEWPQEVSIGELVNLPLRAAVAFASRCARRARLRYDGPQGDLLDEAIGVAEDFARGANNAPGFVFQSAYQVAKTTPSPFPQAAAWAAGHAACAAHRAVDPQCKDLRDVGAAAYQAAAASSSSLVPDNTMSMSAAAQRRLQAERADYEKLLSLRLGQYPEPGLPIDPSENGPLDALWLED